MKVELTKLAHQFILGTLPRSGPSRIQTLDEAISAKIGDWARNKRQIVDHGHHIYQYLEIDPRQCEMWRQFDHIDVLEAEKRVRNYSCSAFGGSVWELIFDGLKKVRSGDMSPLKDINLVENHGEADPENTRLMPVDGKDFVVFAIGGLLGIPVKAWVSFSAVRYDAPRYNGKPSLCGMTAELASQVH